jgi:hypothetical protein
MKCAGASRGKERHATYEAALAALCRIDPLGVGSVYECDDCDGFHVSSRRFMVDKRRGRGKSRRKLVVASPRS